MALPKSMTRIALLAGRRLPTLRGGAGSRVVGLLSAQHSTAQHSTRQVPMKARFPCLRVTGTGGGGGACNVAVPSLHAAVWAETAAGTHLELGGGSLLTSLFRARMFSARANSLAERISGRRAAR